MSPIADWVINVIAAHPVPAVLAPAAVVALDTCNAILTATIRSPREEKP